MADPWTTVNTSEPAEYKGPSLNWAQDQHRNSVYGEDREDLTPQGNYTAPLLATPSPLATPPPQRQFSSPTHQPHTNHNDQQQQQLQVETPRIKQYSGPQLVMSHSNQAMSPSNQAVSPSNQDPVSHEAHRLSNPNYMPPDLPFNTVSGGPSNNGEAGSNAGPYDGRKAALESECRALEKRVHELKEDEARLNRRLQQLQQAIDVAEKTKVDLEQRQKIIDEKEFHIKEREMEIRQKKMELQSEADSLFQRKKELDIREFDERPQHDVEKKRRKLAEKEKELSLKEEELDQKEEVLKQKEQQVEQDQLRAESNIKTARDMFAKARQISEGGMEGQFQKSLSGDRLTLSGQFQSFQSGFQSFDEQRRTPNNYSGDLGYSNPRDQGNQRRSREFTTSDVLNNSRDRPDDSRRYSDYSDDPKRYPDYPDDPRRYPEDPKRYPDDHRRYPDDPKRYYDDPKRYPDDHRRYPDDPKRYPDDPKRYDDPRRYPDDPKRYPDGPRRFSDDKRSHDHSDYPRKYSDHPDDIRSARDFPNQRHSAEQRDQGGRQNEHGRSPNNPFPYPSQSEDGYHSHPSRPVASELPSLGGPSTLPDHTHKITPRKPSDTENDELYARMLQLQVNEGIREEDTKIAAKIAAEYSTPPQAKPSKEEADYHDQLAYQSQLEMMGYTCTPGTPEYEKALKELKMLLQQQREIEERTKGDDELARQLAFQKDDGAT